MAPLTRTITPAPAHAMSAAARAARTVLHVLPLLSLLASCSAAVVSARESQSRGNSPTTISVEEFIRVRCSRDGSPAITAWRGTMYSHVPQERQRPLFGLTGMNIASCFQDENQTWFFSSRELMYYTELDDLDKPLHTWTNPWTGDEMTVAHVANSPVQAEFGNPSDQMNAELIGSDQILAQVADVELFYPNPLFSNASFAPYAPQQWYEGGEFFKFMVTTDDLHKFSPSIPNAWFTWERSSQFLPWMKMGNSPGHLFCSTTGSKVDSLADLPQFIQDDIQERLPLYAQPPGCMQDIPDSTSWTYFRDNFQAWQKGAQFPTPAPNITVPCQWTPVPHAPPAY